MKILALDFGEKRIGLAAADSEIGVALARDALPNDKQIFERLGKICAAEKIEKILVGLPTGHRGQTEQTQSAILFANFLSANLEIEVELVEERFSSKIAHENLPAAARASGKIDSEAARIVLADWLEQNC